MTHWHAREDEMGDARQGDVTLHERDNSDLIRPEGAATLKADDPIGHCLQNQSDSEARYLVMATRSAYDVVTYLDHDRALYADRKAESGRWTDHAAAIKPIESIHRGTGTDAECQLACTSRPFGQPAASVTLPPTRTLATSS